MKVTAKGFLHWHQDRWMESPEFVVHAHDFSKYDPTYVAIRPVETEFEIPDDFDPRPQQIDALRQEKSRILGEAQAKANNIEEQIQRLLCIEYKPEATDSGN